MTTVAIERVTSEQARMELPHLMCVLQDGVASGASIGFLAPLHEAEACAYWDGVIDDVARGACVLMVARHDEQVVGTVQLALATKPNARHRAEVQKLVVARSARRQGIGRSLMEAVEHEARREGRTLLVLDTRQGDAAELLYRRLGYTQAGVIPSFARASTGELDATVLFYRRLD